MNIFVIHKSDDIQEIKDLIKRVLNKATNIKFLILSGNKARWKGEARRKIKMSDCVLVALGEHTHESKNIDYEITYSKKRNKKIFLIKLNDKHHIYNKSLFLKDKFMEVKHHNAFENNKRPLFKEIKENDFIKISQDGYDFDLREEINKTTDPKRIEELIEQYKIYLGTSEDVIRRRQSSSSYYIAINTALVSIMTTVISILLGMASIENKLMVLSIVAISATTLGIILCRNWVLLIDSYGKLNSAKMKVISILEKGLPANIYDTEWRVMNEKIGNTKYRSFTSIEKKVPFTFLLLYATILIISVVFLVVSI